MAEATFIYGQKSVSFVLLNLTPSIVAKKFNANLSELFLIDSKQKLITVDNEKFDSKLTFGESYNVYDDREIPRVEMAVVTPLTNKHVSNFKNSLRLLVPADNINSNIKLQGLALITMNAKDVSLEKGNYKHIKNTKSLRAAVHDLTSAVTKTYLETSSSAGEIHVGLSNVLKGVPDMLKEVDNPNSDSEEIIQDLENWMTETLQECYDKSKKGTQQTEDLLEHIHELESALIASLGAGETKTSSNEVNEEMLQLLKKQQKRFEQAKLDAKHEIDKAWEAKMLDENAQEEYETARENYNKKMREISELEFKIEQTNKNGAKNEDVLEVLRECISEIKEVKENWRNASSSISQMKNKLKVEKEAGRWKNAIESSKIDLNKRYLIENMIEFLTIGYKVDYWMTVQNQIIKNHLLPLASSATNVFGGGKVLSIKIDGFEMIEQANSLVKKKRSEMIKEYESDLRECLSLHSVATIFQSDIKSMDKSDFQYNGKSMSINVQSVTPKQLNRALKVPNIEEKMLQDEYGNLHEMENDKFIPGLEPQRTYVIVDVDNNSEPQRPTLPNILQKSQSLQYPQENDPSSNDYHFNRPYQNPQPDSGKSRDFQQPQPPPRSFSNNQSYKSQAIILQDNTTYLKSGKIFFENITNGCIAIEELVLLAASAPDVKLSDSRLLRVSINDAVNVLGKSYNKAGNTVDEVKLHFNEIPNHIRRCLEAFSIQENTQQYLNALQNTVNSSIKVIEENINLFESPRLEFIELEQSVKSAQKEEEGKNESERKMQSSEQMKMKQIENDIQKKENELKNLDYLIQSLTVEIEAFEKEATKKKEKRSGFFSGGNKTEEQNDELQKQDLQQQKINARKQKHQVQNQIDNLEASKIDVKHKTKNAKTEPSINWEKVIGSLSNIILQIEKIEQTWKSLVGFIKTIESAVNELEFIASKCDADNSRLITAALRVTLNSWVISQCCGIYNDIVKSHIIPLVSSVTSNFGLRVEEAKSKLSSEKTKAQNIRSEVASLADKRLLEAVKNLAIVTTETEDVLCNIFSKTL